MEVMKAESGCDPTAYNPEWHYVFRGGVRVRYCQGSAGLFQISCHSGLVYDPARNIAIAWEKYKASGWKPWGVCSSGKVRCY